MQITPRQGIPSVQFSTTINGRTTEGGLVLPEAFIINGAGVHLAQPGGETGVIYAGQGAWSQAGPGWVWKCNISSAPAIRYEVLVAARGEDTIEWCMTIRNNSGAAWNNDSRAIAHLGFYGEPMQDTDGARTFVIAPVPAGLSFVPVSSLLTIPTSGPYAYQWGLLIKPNGSPNPPYACFPMVARQSADGTQFAGFAVDDAGSLSGNMQQGCIHANPRIGPLAAGGVKTMRGRILLDDASLGAVNLKAPLALYD